MKLEAQQIKFAEQFSAEQVEQLRSYWEAHPYSSTLAVTLAKYYESAADVRYDEMLKIAALITNNRKQLHSTLFGADEAIEYEAELTTEDTNIEHPENNVQSIADPVEEEASKGSEGIVQKEKERTEDQLDAFERQYLAEALGSGLALSLIESEDVANEKQEQPEVVEPESAEKKADEAVESTKGKVDTIEPSKQSFSGWLAYLGEHDEEISKPKPHLEVNPVNFKEVAAIVDRFIEKEDAIVPKRATFFSPAKAAKESITDKEDIVTETLAKVYAAQGSISKAISTYEKLSLLYPEKSSYFAALISTLKSDKKSLL